MKNKELHLTLQKELHEWEEKNTRLVEKLKLVGAHDASENADWQAIRDKITFGQWKISHLKTQLAELQTSNQVNKRVVYRLVATGQEKFVELTSDPEVDPSHHKISGNCPLGKVLLNKKVGEIGEVNTTGGKYQIQIISIQ